MPRNVLFSRLGFLAVFLWVGLLAGGALAAEKNGRTIPLANEYGSIAAVYGHAPGHTPWLLAEELRELDTAEIPAASLRTCSRLIIARDDEAFQFFSPFYYEDATALAVTETRLEDGAPDRQARLELTADGRRLLIPAGLPFHLLAGGMEQGLDADAAQSWLNLMEYPEIPRAQAVVLGGHSWNIAPDDPLLPLAGGKTLLASLRLQATASHDIFLETLADLQDNAFTPCLLVCGDESPLTIEDQDAWERLHAALTSRNTPDSALRITLEHPTLRAELGYDPATAVATLLLQRLDD